MKTAELSGAELDYWVAKAEGMDRANGWGLAWIGTGNPDKPGKPRCNVAHKDWEGAKVFAPSRNWSQAGPIIEREKIGLAFGKFGGQWHGMVLGEGIGLKHSEVGPTPLVAAMRAYVASKFGDTVPDEQAA